MCIRNSASLTPIYFSVLFFHTTSIIFCSMAHFDQWHTSKCEQKPQNPCVGGHALSCCAQNLEAMTLWKSPNESAGEWGASLEKNWGALAITQPKSRSMTGAILDHPACSGLLVPEWAQQKIGNRPASLDKRPAQPIHRTTGCTPGYHFKLPRGGSVSYAANANWYSEERDSAKVRGRSQYSIRLALMSMHVK